MGKRCTYHATPVFPLNVALTSPTNGGRSVGIVRLRTKATELLLYVFLVQFSFLAFPSQRYMHFSFLRCILRAQPIFIELIILCTFGEECKLWNSLSWICSSGSFYVISLWSKYSPDYPITPPSQIISVCVQILNVSWTPKWIFRHPIVPITRSLKVYQYTILF
jgi:hypothetical protein